MNYKVLSCAVAIVICGCQPQSPADQPGKPDVRAGVSLAANAETTPTLADGANDAAILIDASDPANSLILGSGAAGGLELYSLDGMRVGIMDERPIGLVDVRYNFPYRGSEISLVIAYDVAATELLAYRLNESGDSLLRISSQAIATESEIEGLCLYHSPLSGKFYAFAAGEGRIQQWEFYDNAGDVVARRIRTIPVGLGAAHCAAYDREAAIYYSQETVGVWRLHAEPETEAEPEAIAFVMPHGPFTGDIKGLAIYEREQDGYLLVSDADISAFQVFDLATNENIGSFSVEGVDESEGIAVASMRLSANYEDGMIVVADDNNENLNTNYKILGVREIAAGLAIESGGGTNTTAKHPPTATSVSATVETDPVVSYGDAADDPAIWVHPQHPELSLIIGAQKQRGVNVYDLDGSLRQSLPDGRINNIDVRYGFDLGGTPTDIVSGSNRTTDSISVYRVIPGTRLLENVTDGVIATGMSDPYGSCMYRSPKTGDYFVFVNDTDGVMKQFRILDSGNGRVGAEQVREFSVGSQTEGCVADDETGDLYVGEEEVALWKYSAEPDGGDSRTEVDRIDGGNLDGDIEGLALYFGPNGSGYLIASNQGVNNYAVYERAGNNNFIGLFHVVANERSGIDGVSETDGLDVTSSSLGPAFPNGVFVAQDGRNITPAERQNFKLVPWERIAEVMGLETHNGYDPRAAKLN